MKIILILFIINYSVVKSDEIQDKQEACILLSTNFHQQSISIIQSIATSYKTIENKQIYLKFLSLFHDFCNQKIQPQIVKEILEFQNINFHQQQIYDQFNFEKYQNNPIESKLLISKNDEIRLDFYSQQQIEFVLSNINISSKQKDFIDSEQKHKISNNIKYESQMWNTLKRIAAFFLGIGIIIYNIIWVINKTSEIKQKTKDRYKNQKYE